MEVREMRMFFDVVVFFWCRAEGETVRREVGIWLGRLFGVFRRAGYFPVWP